MLVRLPIFRQHQTFICHPVLFPEFGREDNGRGAEASRLSLRHVPASLDATLPLKTPSMF
jgi:hypothetical protein